MRVGIDIDGVLADFTAGFRDAANRMFPGALPPDYVPQEWHWPELTGDQVDRVWEEVKRTNNFWLNLSPLPGAEDVQLFSQHDIFFVTSRIPTKGLSVMAQSSHWVRRHLLKWAYFSVVPAHSHSKGRIYDAADIVASIDDYHEGVRENIRLARKYKNNHQAFLLDRPWNQSATDLDDVRVKSIAEFHERITNG